MGSSLPMSTRIGGVAGRDGCIPYEGVDIAGLGGVVDQPAGVADTDVLHRGQYVRVELQTPCDRQGISDRPARQLVAE
jgi:hypothetical protein